MNISAMLVRRLNLKTALSALTIISMGAFGTATMAQEPSARLIVTGTAKVSLTGLDLSTPDGVRAARQRVRAAAQRVCAKVADSADMSTRLNYLTCIENAMASTVAQIEALAIKNSAQRLANSSGK
jgi:UrcA family protein